MSGKKKRGRAELTGELTELTGELTEDMMEALKTECCGDPMSSNRKNKLYFSPVNLSWFTQ